VTLLWTREDDTTPTCTARRPSNTVGWRVRPQRQTHRLEAGIWSVPRSPRHVPAVVEKEHRPFAIEWGRRPTTRTTPNVSVISAAMKYGSNVG